MVPRRQSCFAALAAGLLWLCGVLPAHALHAPLPEGIPISPAETRVGDFSRVAAGRLSLRDEFGPANTPGWWVCGYKTASGRRVWKLYGPDLNGVYGGLNGTGGFDGVSPYLDTFYPTISDYRGNILGEVTNGVVSWFPSRPTGYGAVPGYRPVALGHGADVAQASAWRGHWPDITGYYNLGRRLYDPVAGMWLSYDSKWNAKDPNYLTFCGGDPIDSFDSDGRLGKGFYQSGEGAVTGTAGLLWNIGGSIGYGLTSLFSQEAANDIYGNQLQGLENTGAGLEYLGNQTLQGNFGTVGTALTGGANQSGAYRVGYGAASIGLIFAGGELGEAGDVGEGATAAEAGSQAGQVVGETPPMTVLEQQISETGNAAVQQNVGSTITTPYSVEAQSPSAEAQAALAQAQNGAPLYRMGQLGESMAGESQYWSLQNPLLNPNYANAMGMPNVTPDFIMGGTLNPGASVIANEAAGLGANAGQGIQIVTQPGGVGGLSFHMP